MNKHPWTMPAPIVALVAYSLSAFALPALVQAQVIIDTQFGTGPAIETPAPDRITGVLPTGWSDNTSWARVWVDYRPGDDQGRPYTRVLTSKIEEGWTQLQHPLPQIDSETYVRLELTARSLDDKILRVGLRDMGLPYQWHCETSPALNADWKSLRYEFRLGKIDHPIGLYLASEGTGNFDLASVRLTYFNRDQLIAEMKQRAKNTGTKNLLRQSRFPLGLQMGWSLDRDYSDGDEVVIESERNVQGPSGFSPLHVQGKNGVRLHAAPFGVPNAFGKHVASVSLMGTASSKGNGPLNVRVICDGRTLASQNIALSDQWQRLHLTFEPRLLADCYSLQFESKQSCDFYLDAMQVAPENPETGGPPEFAAQMPYEVALQIPASDASAARVQFDDEPAMLDYCVTSTAPNSGATLHAKVFNAYGESHQLQIIPLQDAIAYGRFEDVMQQFDKRYGPHRLEAWVEDAAGTRISTFNEMLIYRLPRPRYWGKDAPNSAFGVHTNSTTRHCVMLKAIGANWTRLHDAGLDYIGWYHLEPEKGKWQFRDAPIQRYRQHHVMILGELGTAPPWASYHPGYNVNGYFDRFYQPRDMADYAHYVRTVVERYQGTIHAWDVWNEPWITAWWAVGYDKNQGSDRAGYVRSPTAPADFARLMKTAYTNVKAIDPQAIVLGINTTTGGGGSDFSGDQWTQGVVDAGGLNHADAIAYHHYTSAVNLYPDDDVQRGYHTAVGYVADNNGGKLPMPVWMTEGQNALRLALPDMYHHSLPNLPADSNPFLAGDRQVRFLTALRAQGVAKIFLYSMHSYGFFDGGGTWRAITTGDGFLHTQGAAIAALTQQIEDHHFLRRDEVVTGVWAYVFQADDGSRTVTVLSPEASHEEYRLPAGTLDLFGNPLPAGTPIGKTVCYLPQPL